MIAAIARQFDRHAGHIHIASGSMPIIDIDWASIACTPELTFEEFLTPHLLQGVEARTPTGSRISTVYEYYVTRKRLRLHTDDFWPTHPYVLGMILDCEDDLILTTGRSTAPARPGDVYLLDAGKLHGTMTEGFMAFAAHDFTPSAMPSPTEFRTSVLDELREILRATGAHHKTLA